MVAAMPPCAQLVLEVELSFCDDGDFGLFSHMDSEIESSNAAAYHKDICCYLFSHGRVVCKGY